MRRNPILRPVVLAALALLAVLTGACSSLAGTALLGDRAVFTAGQLQGYLDRRFPRDYDRLGGAVTLSVLSPRIRIPAGGDRVLLDFDFGLGALGQDSRTPAGHLAVSSGLRWDPGTRGLHLDAPALESLDAPRLGGAMDATARGLVDAWLQDYARREPVYEFDDSLVQRIAARRIDSTTIEDGQVVVHLGR